MRKHRIEQVLIELLPSRTKNSTIIASFKKYSSGLATDELSSKDMNEKSNWRILHVTGETAVGRKIVNFIKLYLVSNFLMSRSWNPST